jgi:hypothetical protein
VRPWVRGFIGYSPSETVETAEGSGIYVVQLRRQERWQPQMVLPNLVDCDGAAAPRSCRRRSFPTTGEPTNAAWLDVPPDDPILSAVCGGGAAAS